MKNQKILILSFFSALIISCAHDQSPNRSVANEKCGDKNHPEYHSYFESYEKCLDKGPKE